MKTVRQVSALCGISVRTLHHYDAIGLLKPSFVSESGYRYYGDDALRRLQSILLFRELAFPLKEIKRILDSPNYQWEQALQQQIRLLELRQQRLAQILNAAREIQRTGVKEMLLSVFDTGEIEAYAAEAKAKWGKTDAYQAYEARSAERSKAGQAAAAEGLMALFQRFGEARVLPPDGEQAQGLVQELQAYITDHFYPCTGEILQSLGELYENDARMRQSIDDRGGEGTAAFAAKAIRCYCCRD